MTLPRIRLTSERHPVILRRSESKRSPNLFVGLQSIVSCGIPASWLVELAVPCSLQSVGFALEEVQTRRFDPGDALPAAPQDPPATRQLSGYRTTEGRGSFVSLNASEGCYANP